MGNIRHEYPSQNHLIKPSSSGCSKFRRGVVKNTRGVVNFDWGVVMYQNRSPNTLIIGKFCAIAEGVKFIMNGANHRMDGITTYPFNILGGGWEKVTPTIKQLPFKGDTVIGNDVWIGQNVTIMPGVKVGDGAIIAANSTVVKNIEPYTIYGGNPAKFIKKRFSDEKVEFLLNLQWWNWDEEKIFNNLEMLTSETDNFWNEENLNERKQI